MVKIKKSQASPKPPPRNLSISNTQKTIAISPHSVDQVVQFFLENNGLQGKEMAVHFVGKQRITSLHTQFFDDPTPTDCITFPCDDPNSPICHLLGEIFICPQTAQEFVKKHGGNLYEEMTLYLIHGFLHLLGFDDIDPQDQKIMRAEEKKWMSALAKNHLGITP